MKNTIKGNEEKNLGGVGAESPLPAHESFNPPVSKPDDSLDVTREKARLAVVGYAQARRARLDIDVALFVMAHKLDVFRETVVEFTGEGGACSVFYMSYSKMVAAGKAWPAGWRWVTPYSGHIEDARKVEARIKTLKLSTEYAAALSRITGGNLFEAINATPEQRCIAALEAVNAPARDTGITT